MLPPKRKVRILRYKQRKKIKVMQNTHIQTAIQKVSTSFPSLFSREDVIKLLMDLSADMQDEAPKPKIDLDTLITTFRQVLSEKDWDNVVDKDEVELSMGYDNKVEVDRVTIDEDFLIGEVVDALEAVYNALDEEAN